VLIDTKLANRLLLQSKRRRRPQELTIYRLLATFALFSVTCKLAMAGNSYRAKQHKMATIARDWEKDAARSR